MHIRRKHILLTAIFGVAWITSVALGLRALVKYESTPGRVGAVSQRWPSDSEIRHAHDRPTLIMLAHPHCPCTRASMIELAKIMARIQGRVKAYVLFVKPRQLNDNWAETELRRSAASIPGVTVLSDEGGREARRFGGETSGHTLLFDREGRLLFSGGITQSRGHAGGNAGESAIVAIANNQRSQRSQTFVFGCPLTKHPQKEEPSLCLK